MPAWAQNSAPALRDAINGYESAAHQSFQGLPTDWSSHHVIFSKPAPGSDAEYNVQQDPRYWQQLIRRSQAVANDDMPFPWWPPPNHGHQNKGTIQRDWNVPLGVGGKLAADNYPAKLGFATTGTATCSDFVVFPTGLAGTSTQATIVAYSNLYTGTCTGPTSYWAYNTNGGTASTSNCQMLWIGRS